MKFVDEAGIHVKGGDGGSGCASFRREKFIPRGGPDGGDGGKGGDVIIQGAGNLSSLLDFKYRRIYKAENGRKGGSSNRRGRDGGDILVPVPLGTLVFSGEADSFPLCDIVDDGQAFVVARGGKGGRGNAHFATPTHRAPMEHEPGEPGEERQLTLILKLLAHVGIVGLPNAGKSTLISRLTEARPRIGDYPFTTLTPSLGVFDTEEGTLVIADIPGIVDGASEGRGLGLNFLKHIERTRMLLWVLDLSGASAMADYNTLVRELGRYRSELLGRERITVLNKVDAAPRGEARRVAAALRKEGETTVTVSALTGKGLDSLRSLLHERGLRSNPAV